MEISGDITDAGWQTNSEDRATQPMDAGGWVSQYGLHLTTLFNYYFDPSTKSIERWTIMGFND